MPKFEEKVEQLIAKHPSLSKDEATKILTEKNERKKKKRAEKTDRINAKKSDNREAEQDQDLDQE